MQIHEITLITRPLVAEGIFDTLKAAATWQPGETFAQAKANVKNDAGVAKVAKKAQAAWAGYERQLQQSISQQPAVAVTAPTTNKPPNEPVVSSGKKLDPNNLSAKPSASFGKVPSATAPAKPGQMPASVAKSAQGKKMIKALGTPKGGIQGMQSDLEEASLPDAIKGNMQQWKDTFKGSTPATKPTTTAASVAPANTSTTPVAPATKSNPIDAYKNRTDGKYEQALKAFVQKNLLAGMPYARLQNAQEIDRLINAMSLPQNADPKTQAPLWQQLALAAAVAATVPQSAGGAGPEPTDNKQGGEKNQQGQTAEELLEPVKQFMAQNKIDIKAPGQLLRSQFNNNETAIRSTGNPNVDAMLMAMGFTI